MLLKRSAIALVLLVLLVGLMAASASAASADTDKKSGDGGYVITFNEGKAPIAGKSSSDIVMPMSSSGSIRQGETQWRTRIISQYTTSFDIGLYWGNPSNSLRMRIYTPDGYIYGPYYDNCDGKYDGNIWITISRPGGVAQGTYYIEIYGDRVYGVQSYTLYP